MKISRIGIGCVSTIAAAVLLSGTARSADTGGPRFGPQASTQVELGEQGAIEPPPPAGIDDGTQPVPQRSKDAQPIPQSEIPPPRPEPQSVPQPAPQSTAPREETIDTVARAQQLIAAGQYGQAIELASRSIALDPDNAAAYKNVRAAAYQRMGRYTEALADSNPLEVTVAVPRAELKTKQIVIDVVPAGTKLLVDDVRGNWLKVASSGERNYEWAWIHIRDVAGGNPVAGDPPRLPARIDYDIPSLYVAPPSAGIYIQVSPGSLHANYGRDYYDWWGHVPSAYWGFLPR